MIEVKMTSEFLVDIFTPMSVKNYCAEGLPEGVKLTDVTMKNEIITYLFDDGKDETTPCRFVYKSAGYELEMQKNDRSV